MNILPAPQVQIQLQARLASSDESCFHWFSKVIKLLRKDKKTFSRICRVAKDVRTRFLLFTQASTKWPPRVITYVRQRSTIYWSLCYFCSDHAFVGPLRFGAHSFSLSFSSLLLAGDKKRMLLHTNSVQFIIQNHLPVLCL
jgi:hypothetical protein